MRTLAYQPPMLKAWNFRECNSRVPARSAFPNTQNSTDLGDIDGREFLQLHPVAPGSEHLFYFKVTSSQPGCGTPGVGDSKVRPGRRGQAAGKIFTTKKVPNFFLKKGHVWPGQGLKPNPEGGGGRWAYFGQAPHPSLPGGGGSDGVPGNVTVDPHPDPLGTMPLPRNVRASLPTWVRACQGLWSLTTCEVMGPGGKNQHASAHRLGVFRSTMALSLKWAHPPA